MIVLKSLLNNYCSFDKYIIHYYFTLNLFFKPYVQLIRMHHEISRLKDIKLINSTVGISLHNVLRNYMEMMFIIVDTVRPGVADSCLPHPSYQSIYILHTASRRPVTGCSNCFASSENRWIT